MERRILFFYGGVGVTDQVRMKPLDKKDLMHKGHADSILPSRTELGVKCYAFVCLQFIISFQASVAYQFCIFQHEKTTEILC